MQGPIAATTSLRRAPRLSIASSAASVIPAIAPFHPACAAATTPTERSANSTGTQSAVRMPSKMPGVRVASASASSRAVRSLSASTIWQRLPCT